MLLLSKVHECPPPPVSLYTLDKAEETERLSGILATIFEHCVLLSCYAMKEGKHSDTVLPKA